MDWREELREHEAARAEHRQVQQTECGKDKKYLLLLPSTLVLVHALLTPSSHPPIPEPCPPSSSIHSIVHLPNGSCDVICKSRPVCARS